MNNWEKITWFCVGAIVTMNVMHHILEDLIEYRDNQRWVMFDTIVDIMESDKRDFEKELAVAQAVGVIHANN